MRVVPEVFVYAYIGDAPVVAGRLTVTDGVGRFVYEPTFLENPKAFPLDPINLPLREAEHVTTADGGYFGVMLDCCAQEWGQRVLHMVAGTVAKDMRDEVLKSGGSDPHHLLILGSGFGTGALRFNFLPFMEAADLEPTLSDIDVADMDAVGRLAAIMARAELNEPLTEQEQSLLAAGLSLGGSRPKALVAKDGAQWIAKFHRARESVDIQRVELAVNHLAAAAGVRIAECGAEAYVIEGEERTVFLSRRFDRRSGERAVHYISAASLLGAPRTVHAAHGAAVDLKDAQSRFTYMDIAQVIRRISAAPREDLAELYRRMCFNAVIGNRDDHLCNHGFLREPSGALYRLSPAFDIALSPHQPAFHPIGLGSMGRVGSIENLLSRCGEFGLKRSGAIRIIEQVVTAVGKWQEVFALCEVSPTDTKWAVAQFMSNPEKQLADVAPAMAGADTPRMT